MQLVCTTVRPRNLNQAYLIQYQFHLFLEKKDANEHTVQQSITKNVKTLQIFINRRL